jgi:hypothetical protein
MAMNLPHDDADDREKALREAFGSRMNDPVLGIELREAARIGAEIEREKCARELEAAEYPDEARIVRARDESVKRALGIE